MPKVTSPFKSDGWKVRQTVWILESKIHLFYIAFYTVLCSPFTCILKIEINLELVDATRRAKTRLVQSYDTYLNFLKPYYWFFCSILSRDISVQKKSFIVKPKVVYNMKSCIDKSCPARKIWYLWKVLAQPVKQVWPGLPWTLPAFETDLHTVKD